MADQKLVEYITAKINLKESKQKIRQELSDNGWSSQAVDEAFSVIEDPKIAVPKPSTAHFFSVGELFSESFKLFKERFWSLLLLTIFPGILATLILIFSGIIYGVFSVQANQGTAIAVLLLLALLLFIPIFIYSIWSGVAILTSVCSAEKISFTEAYKRSWKNILPFFVLGILQGIILLGGSFLFFIPAIIFSIWFVFAYQVLVIDGIKGFRALLTSREYVRGYFWGIIGRMILANLALVGIMIVFNIITSILGADATSSGYSFFLSMIIMIYSIFTSCFGVTLFRNIRDVKGKLDITISTKSKVIYSLIGAFGIICIFCIPLFFVSSIFSGELSSSSETNSSILKARTKAIENDKIEITNAIVKYYAAKKSTPESLEELVPVYLKEVPQGPLPYGCYTVAVAQSSGDITIDYVFDDSLCNVVTFVED